MYSEEVQDKAIELDLTIQHARDVFAQSLADGTSRFSPEQHEQLNDMLDQLQGVVNHLNGLDDDNEEYPFVAE